MGRTVKSNIQSGLEALCKQLGGDLLGVEFMYEPWVPSSTTISIDDCRVAFARHGLDERHLPELPSPKAAFGRAIRRARAGQVNGLDVERKDISKGHCLPKGHVYAFSPVSFTGKTNGVETVDQLTVSPKFEDVICRVAYIPDDSKLQNPTGQPRVVCDNDHPLGRSIQEDWHRSCRTIKKADMSAMVAKALSQWHRIPLLRGGKAYFVPKEYYAEVEALWNVLQELDPTSTSTVRLHPMPMVGPAVQSVQNAARKSLEAQIRELTDKVSTFGDTTRTKRMEDTVQEARDLKAKLQMYADICNLKSQDLSAAADKLTKDVYAMMNAS